jgi:hypothetical protein
MDLPILRTLTRKSNLGFGKYADIPIQQIFDYKVQTYLRWVYYSFEGITFTDDILDEIPIHKEARIKKPGNNPGMLKLGYLHGASGLKLCIINKVRKNREVAKYMQFKKSTHNQYFMKSLLQRKNQGH